MTDSIESRVTNLERRVDRLYNFAAAAFFMSSVLGGGYLWFGSKTLDKVDKSGDSIAQIQTDITIIKAEQVRQSKDGDRAWKLVQTLMKNPPKVDDQ